MLYNEHRRKVLNNGKQKTKIKHLHRRQTVQTGPFNSFFKTADSHSVFLLLEEDWSRGAEPPPQSVCDQGTQELTSTVWGHFNKHTACRGGSMVHLQVQCGHNLDSEELRRVGGGGGTCLVQPEPTGFCVCLATRGILRWTNPADAVAEASPLPHKVNGFND